MEAICVLKCGIVRFRNKDATSCLVSYVLQGLTPGNHGLHVHRYGDLTKGCTSTCDHYNPTGSKHGGPKGARRHRGDLGNIYVDRDGNSRQTIECDVRVEEIVGRALVLHADEDDLGTGGTKESETTGSAGARIDCGIIGISKEIEDENQPECVLQ